jgi:acetyl-CoA C-acetyltransferase
MSNNDFVIISGVRTPFGRFGGSLKDVNVIDLGAEVMKEAMNRAGLKPEQIDEVWWGCGDTSNTDDVFTPVIGRQSLLEAGLPRSWSIRKLACRWIPPGIAPT